MTDAIIRVLQLQIINFFESENFLSSGFLIIYSLGIKPLFNAHRRPAQSICTVPRICSG